MSPSLGWLSVFVHFPSSPSDRQRRKIFFLSPLHWAQNIWDWPSPFWCQYTAPLPSRTLINVSWPLTEPKGPIGKLDLSSLGLFCCSLHTEPWFHFSRQPPTWTPPSTGCCLHHWAPQFLQRASPMCFPTMLPLLLWFPQPWMNVSN